jgi:hypothetical protein
VKKEELIEWHNFLLLLDILDYINRKRYLHVKYISEIIFLPYFSYDYVRVLQTRDTGESCNVDNYFFYLQFESAIRIYIL